MRILAVVLVFVLGVVIARPMIGLGDPAEPRPIPAPPGPTSARPQADSLAAPSSQEAEGSSSDSLSDAEDVADRAAPVRVPDEAVGPGKFDPLKAALADIASMKVGKYDWPQWGGSKSRMNTPYGKNIPIDWDIGDYEYDYRGNHPRIGQVPNGSRNIKWVAALGSQTYGMPVVANGRIFIGTNNDANYLGRLKQDMGVLLCFDEETGRFLWQHSNEKLATGRVNDWPMQGVCSTPVVDGNRLWYVSNRGEVVCLDTEGFVDNEDDGLAVPDRTEGQWVALLEVPALLQDDLPRLRTAFAQAGIKLGGRMRIRKIGQRLTVAEYLRSTGVRRYRWVPSYELRIDDGVLHALELSGDAERTAAREIFTASNDLFPGLQQNMLEDALRDLISAQTGQLPDEVPLTVLEADREWEFQADLNGEPRTLRLTRTSGQLTISKQLEAMERDEADVVWKRDMINEFGVFPHNMSTCSVLTVDGRLFVCTSNAVDESHSNIPSPRSPSFMAFDRETGKVLWEDNTPLDRILHGQWASPSYGVFNGQAQVIFPGGDGWLYSFDPAGDGNGKSRLLWKFDVNPKESKWSLGGRGTRNNLVAFPAIYDGLVYIASGQDPEHGEGDGGLWCLDPTVGKDGADVSAELVVDLDGKVIADRVAANGLRDDERAVANPNSAVKWYFTGEDIDGDGKIEDEEVFHRTLSTPVIKDDIMFAPDLTGYLHCLDAKTGKSYWNFDLFAASWGSPLLVDGHVYVGDEDGDMHIFKHSADRKVALMESNEPNGNQGDFSDGRVILFDSSLYGTAIVANNVLYVTTRNSLFAIEHRDVESQSP